MVIHNSARSRRIRGSLMVELLVAMALMTGALLPLAYSLASERRLARATYQRAVAMEIVDGEIEVLAAGEWRVFSPGTQPYSGHAVAATNLPPGKFLITVGSDKLRLEWMIFYFTIGEENTTKTALHFGVSRRIFIKWKSRFNPQDMTSLEDHVVRADFWTPKEQGIVNRKGVRNEQTTKSLHPGI